MTLHISTEGATAGTIKQSSLEGSVLPWFEHWYEGPVPESLSRDDLLHDRTQYFTTGNQEEDRSTRFLTETFTKMRKEEFADLSQYGEIVLWFNSAVGEQLNLIDVITQIQEEAAQPLRLTRVAPTGCIQAHSTAQLAELGPGRIEVSSVLCDGASSAWQAFRTADPRVLEKYIASNSGDLPELCAALERFLEELPAADNGLSRFEALILSALSKDQLEAMSIMVDHADEWDDPLFAYIDSRALQRYLLRLGQGTSPLIQFADGETLTPEAVWRSQLKFLRRTLRITPAGRRVLDSEDHLALNKPRRWLGAYCLEPGRIDWRWDTAKRKVTVGSAW